MYDLETLFAIALTKIPHVGSITARTLLSYCGSFEAIFKEKKNILKKIPGIGLKTAISIQQSSAEPLYHQELKFLEENKVSVFHILNPEFPRRLKNCVDAPVVLYYKGSSKLNPNRSLSIVGTRQPSEYGKLQTEKIVRSLAKYNIQILSGLAYGVDATVHQSCLSEKLETLGILGHGLDRIYPYSHRKIAERMLLNGGLLTEYPSNTKPDRENFPMRNRIIAGMSDAIVVIESAKKGGSIITAKLGNDYNRDVFALPGRASDGKSRGCNFLIKSNLAQLVENAEDIAEFMRWDEIDDPRIIQPKLFEELGAVEKLVVGQLNDNESLAIDQIQYIIQKSPSDTATLLLDMEFKGIIKSLPGKRFSLF